MKPMTFLRGRLLLLPALISLCFLLNSCTKDEDDPPVTVQGEPTSFHKVYNERIMYKFPFDLDIDEDNAPEYRIGSSVEGDGKGLRMTFYVENLRGNQTLTDEEGLLAALRAGEVVSAEDVNWSSQAFMLCEKYSENGVVTWTGGWKDNKLHYLPIRFRTDNAFRLGWISMTIDTQSHEIILHELAYDLTGANNIQTGDF